MKAVDQFLTSWDIQKFRDVRNMARRYDRKTLTLTDASKFQRPATVASGVV